VINPNVVFVVENSISYRLYNIPYEQLHRYVERLRVYDIGDLSASKQKNYIKKFSILDGQIIEEKIKTTESLVRVRFTKINSVLFQKLRDHYKFVDLRRNHSLIYKTIEDFDLKKFLFFEDYIHKFLDENIILNITPNPTEIELGDIFSEYDLNKNVKSIFFISSKMISGHFNTLGYSTRRFSYISHCFKGRRYFYGEFSTNSIEFCVMNKDLLREEKYLALFNRFSVLDENTKKYQYLHEILTKNISHYVQRQILMNRKSKNMNAVKSKHSNSTLSSYKACRFCGKPVVSGSDVCYACS
jgi:DNA-binding phage protein